MFKHLLELFKEYKEEVRMTSLEKLRRERESISKLQELIGLSSNSNFFLKKRS